MIFKIFYLLHPVVQILSGWSKHVEHMAAAIIIDSCAFNCFDGRETFSRKTKAFKIGD